jgi:stage III sporulation protein SpoIIIAA
MLLADDLNQLLDILPQYISIPLKKHPKQEQLIEIVLDIGRRPEARFSDGASYLSYRTIVWQDLDFILKRLGKFSGDNRAGIEKTLHRISSLRNRQGSVIGLTCRIGRALFGTVSIIRDLLENKKSILLLGRPGVGKTTAIREIARVLSDGMKKRVIIIDTSNEIAGDGDLPHPSIGKARRMQVSSPQNQHQVMIEAVENHMPEIIIIDEIGTELEAAAARTIAERGVQLVGTAHGNALENLIKNPTITDLIGGIQYVTLGDEEAKRRSSSKSILERKAPPTFEVAVEIHDAKTWVIHENIEQSVDLLLQGQNVPLQKRKIINEGNNIVQCEIITNQKEPQNLSESYYKKSNLEKRQKDNYLLKKITKNEDWKAKSIGKPDLSLKNKLFK